MSYRQENFDLMSPPEPSRPLRPFNWVQWSGVAFGALGALLIAAHVAGKIGWMPLWFDKAMPGPFMLMMFGSLMINSRREALPGEDELQRAKNRRAMFITTALLTALFAAVLVIEFTGA